MANADPIDMQEPPARAAPRARTVLARRLADLVGLPSSRITPRERWIVADLLLEILRNSDVSLRRRCAERLAALGEAPHSLLRMLACEGALAFLANPPGGATGVDNPGFVHFESPC